MSDYPEPQAVENEALDAAWPGYVRMQAPHTKQNRERVRAVLNVVGKYLPARDNYVGAKALASLSPDDRCGPEGSCVVVSAERLAELEAFRAQVARMALEGEDAFPGGDKLFKPDPVEQNEALESLICRARSIGGEG